MTTIETHAEGAQVVGRLSRSSAGWRRGPRHNRSQADRSIYLGFGLLGLLAVGVLGVLLGIERASDTQVFDSGSLLQMFQAQRVGLAFAGSSRSTLGLSIAVVPLQLGARQIAYPRLALAGCYMWLGGLALTFAGARPQRRRRRR